jgi:hypothetical protein
MEYGDIVHWWILSIDIFIKLLGSFIFIIYNQV